MKKVKPSVGFEPTTPGIGGYKTPAQRKLSKTPLMLNTVRKNDVINNNNLCL